MISQRDLFDQSLDNCNMENFDQQHPSSLLSMHTPYIIPGTQNQITKTNSLSQTMLTNVNLSQPKSSKLFYLFNQKPKVIYSRIRSYIILLTIFVIFFIFLAKILELELNSVYEIGLLASIFIPLSFVLLMMAFTEMQQKKGLIARIKKQQQRGDAIQTLNKIDFKQILPADAAITLYISRYYEDGAVDRYSAIKLNKLKLKHRKFPNIKIEWIREITESYVNVRHQIRLIPKNQKVHQYLFSEIQNILLKYNLTSISGLALKFDSKMFEMINNLQDKVVLVQKPNQFVTFLQFLMIALQPILFLVYPIFYMAYEIMKQKEREALMIHEFEIEQDN